MRTTIVIGIVLMSMACLAPTAAAGDEPASEPGSDLTTRAGCIVVDPSETPPVHTEPCLVGQH